MVFIPFGITGVPFEAVVVKVGERVDDSGVAHPANSTVIVTMTVRTKKIHFLFKPDSSGSSCSYGMINFNVRII